MLGNHASIDIGQSTEYAKEMRKWEAYPTKYGAPGRPHQYREYPKRMYKAAYVSGKGTEIAEAFTVNDIHEERNMQSRGFHCGAAEAFEAVRQEQTEHGKLSAERQWEIVHGRVSEKAAAEVTAAEQAYGARHLPVMPEAPNKRKGWPRGKKRGKTPEVAEPVSAE